MSSPVPTAAPDLNLDALLAPRTFCTINQGQRRAGLVRPGPRCSPRGRGKADLALVVAAAPQLQRAVARAAARADTVVVLRPHGAAGHDLALPHRGVLLGPGAGLWSPAFQAGLEGPAFRPRQQRPCMVVADTCAVAEHLLACSAARGLRVMGAVSTGRGGSVGWSDVVWAARELDPAPCLLVGLARLPDAESMARAAGAGLDLVLALLDHGPLAGWSDLPPGGPEARVAARALGITVVPSAGEATEAVFLLGRGVRRAGAVVRTAADNADRAALLDLVLDRSGHGAGVRQGDAAGPGARVDCLLHAGPPVNAEPAAVTLRLGGRLARAADDGWASEATLGALAALQAPAWPPISPPRRPRVQRSLAQRLADSWPQQLHELQIKQLLACYDIAAPPERLVTSSSGAGRAARELGFPVALKAVGPDLRGRLASGAVVLDVGSESAARQAFRDVAHACARLDPSPLLEGVLVSAMVGHRGQPAARRSPGREGHIRRTLRCSMLWPAESPPLLEVWLDRDRRGSRRAVLACPATRARCQEVAASLLATVGQGAATRRSLAQLLWRLGWLGEDMQGRLRWLWLDTLALSAAGSAPVVIDGCGLQSED